MQEYELTVLIHTEADFERQMRNLKAHIESLGGVVRDIDDWGIKELAYRIARQDVAHYAFFELDLPDDAPLKLSNHLNITEEVLRYLLVRDNPTLKAAREQGTLKLQHYEGRKVAKKASAYHA